MTPNLKSMSRKELEKLKASVEKAISKLQEKEKKAALAAAEKAAAAHGFSLAEITGEPPQKRRASKWRHQKRLLLQNIAILMTRHRRGQEKGVSRIGSRRQWARAQNPAIWKYRFHLSPALT